MSEIKSTLDLVMERTKHLTMSREEKQQQEAEEVKKQFNGVVQKYLDGLMDRAEVGQAVEEIRKANPLLDAGTLPGVVLERMDLEALQGSLPDLLKDVFGCAVEGLRQLGTQHANEIQAQSSRHADRLRESLKQDCQISGTALMPNLEADPQWTQAKEDILAAYNKKLAAEKTRI